MKKRLLSALLALALVFVLLPTTALADTTPVTDENVKINGSAVTVGNDISLGDGNGTYSYDKSTRTLTLNNATITATGSNIGIDFCDTTNYVTYSVILTGENTVTSNNIAIETTPNTNLTFTGGGNLKAITNGYYQAIRVYGTLTIENSTLIAESSAYTATTVIWTLAMTGNNAKLEISNKSAANIVAGTAGPASNIDWSNYQFTTGSYSGDALTESDPEVCSWGTLKKYFGYPTKEYSQYICIAKRTIPALQRTSDVLIAKENAVVGVETSIPSANGSGTYYYDQASKTLTLNNVNITSVTNAIQLMADGTYTINLVGTNTISDASNGIFVLDDSSITSLSVTITGVGSLDISAKGLAIGMKKGDLKFENTGAIKLATGNIGLNNNALSVKGNITITDMSKYSVTGTQQTGGKPLGSEVSLTEASQLKGGTTGYRIITITPAALEKSNVYVAGTNLYKNTAYTIQNGKPVMGGTYPGNYNIYFDTTTTNWTLHVKNAVIDATGTTGIYGTSNIVFEGDNSITASSYGIYSYFKSSDLKISGSGSLMIKTIAACPAIATDYNTSRSIIISGNNFTVTADTSKTTSYAIKSDNDLTIKDGAIVIAKSNATRAIDIKGNLTVENNATLTATSNSTKPTVQVGGNATFTGRTVTITNNSTELHKDATEATKGDSVSSALYVKGDINITDNANVTAKVENGGGNAIGALGNITVNGSNVTAVNKGQKFTTIIAKNVYVSGNSKITANNLNGNPDYNGWYLAFPAIEGNIVNQNTGYSLKFEGQHNGTSEPKTTLAPGEQTTLYYYNVTITRGDEVTRTESPVVIAGTTLLNDTHYTITNGSTVTEGTESNYNAFYDSETKTLKLNNASINGAGVKAIEANVGGYTFTIELVGNNIIKTSGFANNVIDITGNLYFTGSGTAEISGKGMPIYATYKIDVSADVTITNTEKAGSFTFSPYGENYKGANTFAIGAGYTAYATTDKTTWAVYDNTTASENENYTTLRITKENLTPTTPTTYTVTITAGENMTLESGTLIQEVTKGAAITEVKFIAASGHYFPADYVSKMNLPTGFTAEISGNSWYLAINGTPTSNVTINLPATSVRPTITVSMPTPAVAGNTPATASDITLTYTPSQGSSRNLRVGSVIWESYVPDGPKGEFIKVTGTLSSGDKFVEGTKYRATINFEGVSEDYAIVPAAGTTKWSNAEWGSSTMTLYFDATGAPCDHQYTNDWHANGNTHWHECKLCRAHADEVAHTFGDWITDTPATDTTDGSKHRICSVCQYRENATIPKTGTGEIVPPTPDNPGTIVIIRPAEEEKPAQQPNPSTGANDLVGMAVAAAVVAVLGSVALLRKHD